MLMWQCNLKTKGIAGVKLVEPWGFVFGEQAHFYLVVGEWDLSFILVGHLFLGWWASYGVAKSIATWSYGGRHMNLGSFVG
jgi:hypothetical protein